MDIYEELVRLKREGKRFALCQVVRQSGSSPAKEGTKMLVLEDGQSPAIGTLGGGCLEAAVREAALEAIREETGPFTMAVDLTDKEGGLVCGGKVLVYIEPIRPGPHLLVVGAGHVGRALAKAAGFSGFRVTVADDRPEYANDKNIPGADKFIVGPYEEIPGRAGVAAGDFILIATRGHMHDLTALKMALKTDARYIGLLGSRRKKALFFKQLLEEGFTERDMERVITPAGLPIGSRTPEEIAISIVAQLILERRKTRLGDGTSACGRALAEDGQAEATAAPEWQTKRHTRDQALP